MRGQGRVPHGLSAVEANIFGSNLVLFDELKVRVE
jgi:hypothetical protein